ncbi:MAG TPA: substrate-binding and VWA domain-containing protein [Candidatus Stackebrandtia excrementipullorum]|nr:substrate-binding and VWA domain-containing protein [Candidatus Stackebrandtia excrementipullorum]
MAPWIVISTVLALVASGLVLSYTWLLGTGCSGDPLRATVVAAPDIKEPLSVLARAWEREEPSVSGRCIGVEVREKSSSQVATKLQSSWNTVTDGARPHVWIPDSSVWIQMVESTDIGSLMIPDKTPLAATSPTVIAMPKPMAEALGWQSGGEPVADEPSWSNLLSLAESGSWADFGHEEWGDITLGMTAPRQSTAGIHALLSLTDVDRNGDVVSDELDNVVRLSGILDETPNDIDAILQELSQLDPEEDLNGYVSAFPALERDVWRYNNYMENGVELTAVYPSDGSLDADHPIAVLQNVEWTDRTYQEIGWQFASFVTGDTGRELLLEEAFRDGTRRTGGDALNNTEGLTPQIDESQRGPVQPSAVGGVIAAWEALHRAANVLVVLDTSESMNASVQHNGEEVTRLEAVRRELSDALSLFGSQASVGLWEYSTAAYYGEPDYTELVSMRAFDSAQEDAINVAAQQLVPGGGSALYDTAAAAYETLLNNYNDEHGAANLVVIISDGGNDDDNGGLGLPELEAQLDNLASADRNKKASIVTIGFGSDIDAEALTTIAESTQGMFFEAEWNDQLKPQLLNALFNAV